MDYEFLKHVWVSGRTFISIDLDSKMLYNHWLVPFPPPPQALLAAMLIAEVEAQTSSFVYWMDSATASALKSFKCKRCPRESRP